MPKLKPKAAREVLWSRGNLLWKLHAGQKVIEKAYSLVGRKLFVGNCARRFGKTFWACNKAVEHAIRCKNLLPRIKYAAATRLDLEEFALPSFEAILADCPETFRPQFIASKSKYRFPHNGAEIQLLGLDKRPDGGRGNYCDLYIFEEAGFIKDLEYLYGSVVAPMMVRRPGAKIIMISTPPPTPAHPFQKFCEMAQSQDAYAELNIYANPLLTEKDIKEAHEECLDESQWLREYMCQFVVDMNKAIIPEWNEEYEKDIVRPDYFNHLHRYECMDLGVKIDLTAVLFGYYDPRMGDQGLLVIEDEAEISGPKMTTLGLRDLIREKEAKLWGDKNVYKRIADSDNPLLVQDLGSLHGLYFIPTNKEQLHAMVNELRVFIKRGRLRISPKCKKLIGCLKYGIWNNKRSGFDRSKLYGHFDHLAALVYMVRNLNQVDDPVPDLRPMNHDTMFIKPAKKGSKHSEVVKKLLNI